MKKSILSLGKSLNKGQQKEIKGGGIPCFEWCALDEETQSLIWKPLYCTCNTGGGGGTGGGGTGGGSDEWV